MLNIELDKSIEYDRTPNNNLNLMNVCPPPNPMAVVGNECLTMYSEGTLCNFSARSVVKVNRSDRPIITVIFSQASVSHSVHRRMGCLADTPPPADKPLPSACWDTPPCPLHAGIHTPRRPLQRTVRILLECILVLRYFEESIKR